MSLIVCKNLKIGYKGQVVKDNINFSVDKGDYFCIVGENGTGKTTLMKTLLSLQKPLSGKILFSDGLKSNEIGYLPQQATIKKDFPATNFEIVISGCLNKLAFNPFYTKKEKEIALNAMKRMNVLEFKDKSFKELSGGQQQRVLLARALCATSKLLVLDEPVAGLDVNATNEMYDLVNELNKKDKTTIIMISHDIKDVIKYASKVLHIGETVFFGTVAEYKKSKELKRWKL